jgi:hypothetical protein
MFSLLFAVFVCGCEENVHLTTTEAGVVQYYFSKHHGSEMHH